MQWFIIFTVHLHPYYKSLGFSIGDFPKSEFWYSRAISIPLHPNLSLDDQDHIIQVIKDLLKMTICVIPARGGSKRIPKKNIKLFHRQANDSMVYRGCKGIKYFLIRLVFLPMTMGLQN